MVTSIFSVYDSKAKVFAPPFISINDLTAVRDFHRAANDPDSNIFLYPTDYTLFKIGTFDDSTGVITVIDVHENFGLASQFVEVCK